MTTFTVCNAFRYHVGFVKLAGITVKGMEKLFQAVKSSCIEVGEYIKYGHTFVPYSIVLAFLIA